MKPSVFFPEKMDQIKIICPLESSYYLIQGIAMLGNVELIDYCGGNYQITKRHAETYMQCDEADRSLKFIGHYIKEYTKNENVEFLKNKPTFEEYIHENVKDRNLNDVLMEIKDADQQLHEKLNLFQNMNKELELRKEKLSSLKFYISILVSQDAQNIQVDKTKRELGSCELFMLDDNSIINSVSGFLPTESIQNVLLMAYRISRKNIIYHIGESKNGKTQFVIFTSSPSILTKIVKLCEGFTANVFQFSDNIEELNNIENTLISEIEQMENVNIQQRESNNEFLNYVSNNFWNWRLYISQQKQIYLYLDYGNYDKIESSVIFTGWIPHRLKDHLTPILNESTNKSGSAIPIQIESESAEHIIKENSKLPNEERKEIIVPTFIERNEFSYPFQLLNDAYGIPNYDELNGGAFYCMYPMLFAIMFGDVGHAIFYIIASIAILIIGAKKDTSQMSDMGGSVFKLKWLLFFAAICSLYCGFIYNECFGLPFSFFSSSYNKYEISNGNFVWKLDKRNTYPFGIDSTWLFKDNELIFLNSYKMKLSIVIGMIQMIFGMFLQLINHIHRNDIKTILIKWIPQMLYLVPFFGYLVVLIIKKWLTHFQNNNEFSEDVQENGVNLIQVMISMILSMGSKDKDLQLYPSQWNIHRVIVILFFISIPYLLFAKPICDCIKLRGTKNFNVLEIFVMNLIGVIEFCLGALSHTASYLRLWALSLAHSQLSHVIYEEALVIEINSGNPILIFVGFAAFAALSAAILLGMEAFSAFLHAIRLMWVEFSSKFYEGMGVAFKPISLRKEIKHTII